MCRVLVHPTSVEYHVERASNREMHVSVLNSTVFVMSATQQCNLYSKIWGVRVERSSRGGTTAFGADVGRIAWVDRP